MFYTDGILYLGSEITGTGVFVRARTTHLDKVIQAYAVGQLLAWSLPRAGQVSFALPPLAGEQVLLLAVDADEAERNYWPQAFTPLGGGNRPRVQTPQTIAPYGPLDLWKVYLGERGELEASRLVHRQPFYPSLQRAGGLGAQFGDGGFGWDGVGAAGLGFHFGRGEFGFDCEMLTWTSPPLPPGDYPLRVVVQDACGNDSAAWESTVTVHSFARPPADLAATSYDPQTDTLHLSFTPSPDL